MNINMAKSGQLQKSVDALGGGLTKYRFIRQIV